jgi:hypothetical protein
VYSILFQKATRQSFPHFFGAMNIHGSITFMDPNIFQLILAAVFTLAIAPVVYYSYFGKAKQKLIKQYGRVVAVRTDPVYKPGPFGGWGKEPEKGPIQHVPQIKITNAAANAIAAKFGGLILLGLPFIFGGSYIAIVAVASLTPTGHLYLWGTLGTIAALILVFTAARAIVKAALASINTELRKEGQS